jgi:hypothetical protein
MRHLSLEINESCYNRLRVQIIPHLYNTFNINFKLLPVLNLQADVLLLFAIKGDDA